MNKQERPSSSKRSSLIGGAAQRLTPLYEEDFSTIRDEDKKPDAVIIDETVTFKNTMTSDYKAVMQLSLTSEKITYLNYSNSILIKLPHLIRLDLSHNKIEKI